MAAEAGGADLKALDKAKKEAQAKLKKYKVWSKYTKVNKKHKEHKACCKNLKSGNHPLVQALEKCGYHDICVYHTPTQTTQAGSFRAAFLDQLTIGDDVFDVCVTDEAGFVLPPEDANCMQGCSDKATLATIREVATDKEKMDGLLRIGFRGNGYKVIKRDLRNADGGAIVIGVNPKSPSLVKPNYFKLFDDAQGADYWQLYDGATAVDGSFSYKPADVFDVAEGTNCAVMKNKKEFDAMGLAAHTPFTSQGEWDEMCRNVLGRECKVTGIFDGGDGWGGYNASIQVTVGDNTVDAVVPITALVKENPGDTAVFFGEVGQFIFVAEMDLFENNGYCERGKQIQPLAAEWTSIVYNFGNDELGYGEFLDYDDEDIAPLWNNWQPAIQEYLQGLINEETDYADLGFSAE